VIPPIAACVGTGVAMGVSVAGAAFEGIGEAVLVGVCTAVGPNGRTGCGLQPTNTTKIESIMRIRKMVFIGASFFLAIGFTHL